VKILVRNLVNIDYVPTIPEINRLLRAKSIENKISITDLPDEMTFIYAIYARVSEDEILSSDKKHTLNNIHLFLKQQQIWKGVYLSFWKRICL